MNQNAAVLMGGLFVAAIWFVLFFALGIIVSAQGQILKADLDGAVNTSPFMTDDQKAHVMI